MSVNTTRPTAHVLDPARLTMSAHPVRPEEELANAIIIQAVKDYRTALRGHRVVGRTPYGTIKDCEKFFKSEWFKILSKVDGRLLMSKLKKEYEDECQSGTTNT